MIDIRKLKELVRLMVANDLTELDLRDNEEQVTLRRHNHSAVLTPPLPAAPVVVEAPPPPNHAAAPVLPDEDAGLVTIESPMVGTYYAGPNPDAAAFVKVGTTVNADTTVCILEAMKIFNEIKAETSGTIEKVLVGNGDSVEFGQPLFKVRPS